jgi:hypothetical protein
MKRSINSSLLKCQLPELHLWDQLAFRQGAAIAIRKKTARQSWEGRGQSSPRKSRGASLRAGKIIAGGRRKGMKREAVGN